MEEERKRHILDNLRDRYHRGGRKRKSELLEEVIELLGCHRKHAIRAMQKRPSGRRAVAKRGRKSKYDEPEFLRGLHRVRRVMEYRNAEVIKANMVEWLPFIEQHYGIFEDSVRERLLAISASTIKRLSVTR